MRGTDCVENGHKHMVHVIGTNPIGIESSDVLLAEIWHRASVRASRHNRPGYPNVGHYNTWLTNTYQSVAEVTYGVLCYPDWQNASDSERTPECFGIVPLGSSELTEKINARCAAVAEAVKNKLPRDLKYLAKKCGTVLPPLPWTRGDKPIFAKLMAKHRYSDAVAAKQLCDTVLDYVDEVNVHPK